MNGTQEVLELIAAERERQKRLFPDDHHTGPFWLTLLGEELGEVSREIIALERGEGSLFKLQEELVHLAATATAAREDMAHLYIPTDRKKG